MSQWLHTIYKLIIEMHVGIFNIQHCHYFTMQYYDITYHMVNEQLQNIFHELFHEDKRFLCGTRVYFKLKIRYFVCVS